MVMPPVRLRQDRRGASFVDGCETTAAQRRVGPGSLLRRCGCGKFAQGGRGGTDGDALVLAQDEQVSLVAGDDELSFCGEGAGKDVIIIGVAGDARDLGRFGKLHDLDVIGEQRGGGGADPLQLRREGGSGDDLGELFE